MSPFSAPPIPLLTTTNPFCLYGFAWWYFIYKESYNMWCFVSSTKRVFSRSSELYMGYIKYFSVFYGWMLIHCMDIPPFYFFTCWWTFWLLWIMLLWTFVNEYLFEYFWFFWVYRRRMAASHENFNFLRNCHICFLQWRYHLTFPPTTHVRKFLFLHNLSFSFFFKAVVVDVK